MEGAYYANEMAVAEMLGRIGVCQALPGLPVHTAWDIGRRDPTVTTPAPARHRGPGGSGWSVKESPAARGEAWAGLGGSSAGGCRKPI